MVSAAALARAAVTVPSAPTGVTAVAGNAQAAVSWTAPSSNGGAAITSYTVTSVPGAVTATAPAGTTSATVTGLTNGTDYRFYVTAANSACFVPVGHLRHGDPGRSQRPGCTGHHQRVRA